MKAAIETTQQIICLPGSAASAQPFHTKHTPHSELYCSLQHQPELSEMKTDSQTCKFKIFFFKILTKNNEELRIQKGTNQSPHLNLAFLQNQLKNAQQKSIQTVK